MIHTHVLRSKFSHIESYIEVYAAVSATYESPTEYANYIWTSILSQSPRTIPRDERGKQITSVYISGESGKKV